MKLRLTKFNKTKAFFCLSALLFLALFSSCTDDVAVKKEDAATADTLKMKTEATAMAPPTFQGKLSSYNTLFSRSDCSDKSDSASLTGPVNCTTFAEGLKLFERQYNNSDENLKLNPSKVKLNNQLKQVIQQAVAGGRYGLVFHYGYHASGDSLVYIMSRGEIYGEDSLIRHCPFVDSSNNEFYLLMATKNGNGYIEVDEDTLKKYTDAYKNDLRRNGNALSPANKDPQMVYHRASGFGEFLSAYNSQNPTYLYIGHGSLPYTSLTDARHVPVFALGNDQVFFTINNVLPIGSNDFENKGLDIGRLCPPNCPTPVTICN